MVEIIPALLEKEYTEIEHKASLVRGLVPTLQIDVMDGVFAPDVSWPYEDGKQAGFERLLEGDVPLPFWEAFQYEIDLMIQDPEEDISEWIKTGASRIIVHVESTKNLEEIVGTYGALSGFAESLELGLALSIGTPNDILEPYIDRVSVVQFMGISQIGFQGQPFDERVLGKMRDLRAAHPDVTISVDGGVSLKNAPGIIAAGANRLVSGSAIWKSGNPEESIKKFKSLSS
ncbi:MAG: hypothetical protein HY455_02475 [Parcubacteria group bacterium]|nr:hypothetical protein [Parcubacteria group bacterium]